MLKSVSFANPASSIKSNSTTGILQITGPAAGSTRVMTVPDANFTVARIDAAQSFTGDQTLATGNIIQGTAAKGLNFTANTSAAGMTSQLLNWYEEGTWTPVIGATSGSVGSYTVNAATYTRIGRIVVLNFDYTITNVGTSSGVTTITGLPFNIAGGANSCMGAIREVAVLGDAGVVYPSSATQLIVVDYKNSFIGGNNFRIVGSLSYNA